MSITHVFALLVTWDMLCHQWPTRDFCSLGFSVTLAEYVWITMTHLVSPLQPACHRSASHSWTDAPGPPCAGLLPSAPGSGTVAARCIRSPLCLETSGQTKRRKWNRESFSKQQWKTTGAAGWTFVSTQFRKLCIIPGAYVQLPSHTSLLYYTDGTKAGNRRVLSGASQRECGLYCRGQTPNPYLKIYWGHVTCTVTHMHQSVSRTHTTWQHVWVIKLLI